MDKGWKQFERRACRDMGVERQPVTGERHGADNAPHPLFAFQFKLRRMLPSWLFVWLAGIVATAARDGKVGVLVLKRPRLEDADALVVLRWCDWVDLHGPAGFGETAHRAISRGRKSSAVSTSDNEAYRTQRQAKVPHRAECAQEAF
jgi:hypothetical protein